MLLFYWLLPLSHCSCDPKHFPLLFYLSLSRSICVQHLHIGPFKTNPLHHTGQCVDIEIPIMKHDFSLIWKPVWEHGADIHVCVFRKPERLRALCVHSGNSWTCLMIPNLQHRNICAGSLYLIQSIQLFPHKNNWITENSDDVVGPELKKSDLREDRILCIFSNATIVFCC